MKKDSSTNGGSPDDGRPAGGIAQPRHPQGPAAPGPAAQSSGIRRRDFFKALGAGGTATAVLAACVDKPEKLIPFLLPPENVEFVPGQPLDYATTCMECPANCGMIVKTREGRAIKAEGNPDHPISQGALCMIGQASVQTLYNPARLRSAMRREGGSWKTLGQAAAEKLLADKVSSLADKGQIAYITGNAAGTRGAFIDQWLSAVGASPKLVLEPLGLHNLREANRIAFRRAEVPQHLIGEAQLLVNFGSEFLETWQNPVENARQFADMHAYNEARQSKGKYVHIGPHQSLTGANADQWISVAPGSEAVVALALAGEVLKKARGTVSAAERDRLVDYLGPYTLERAAKASGADVKVLKELAAEISKAAPSLVLAGGNALATTEGTQTQLAVNILNYVAGNIGKTLRFGASRQVDLSSSHADVLALLRRMQAGEVKLLIVDGANPLYNLPAAAKAVAALSKVEMVVSLSSAWDETTQRAHLALPGLTPLERWGDARPHGGAYSLLQPVMAPVFPLPGEEGDMLKAAEDSLLAVAAQLGLNDFAATPTYKDYLRRAWTDVQKQVGDSEEFETFWSAGLQRGGVFRAFSGSTVVQLSNEALQFSPDVAKLTGEGLALLPTVSLRHRDGRGASNPWLQEIPDPVSQVVWDSWADIHPETARAMGIFHGDQIRLSSDQGEIVLAAYMHYGVHRQTIAVPLGQGHTGSGRNADLVGVNVLDLLPMATDRASGQFAYLSTRVKVERTGKPGYLVQMDGSPRQMDRGIIQTQSLADVKAGKAPASEHGGEHARKNVDFYPERKEQTPGYHDPYRWGMVVDSDRCTGCSACVAACYSENNIAVVGKTRAGLGREMPWLAINRFLEGKGDSYRTLMQPMMCQQCGNAGCEPVCPVYATYHNPEGLNAQIYNRCVGTRYCSNNCAYKVRRFNWFNYEWESPLNLQLNPDVTVRSKGVMEKCTFCVQRINRARMDANAEGRNIAEGEVTPACVQTCPTRALTFGNLADPQSRVSKQAQRNKDHGAERVRQYEVFPELKQAPGVTYLRKVTFDASEEA